MEKPPQVIPTIKKLRKSVWSRYSGSKNKKGTPINFPKLPVMMANNNSQQKSNTGLRLRVLTKSCTGKEYITLSNIEILLPNLQI